MADRSGRLPSDRAPGVIGRPREDAGVQRRCRLITDCTVGLTHAICLDRYVGHRQ